MKLEKQEEKKTSQTLGKYLQYVGVSLIVFYSCTQF